MKGETIMEREIIQPFSMVSEAEAEELMKGIRKEQEKIRIAAGNAIENNEGDLETIPASVHASKITNKQNPFLNACKKVFKFIKDNVNVDVNLGGSDFNGNSEGVIAPPTDRLSSILKPTISVKAGPLEVELTPDIIKNPLNKIRTY